MLHLEHLFLGTSIQIALLYCRLQTPKIQSYPKNFAKEVKFLKKVFGFTDQLDSLNRWYADFIDADKNQKLSKYRDSAISAQTGDLNYKKDLGQIWELSEKLGHNLNQSLVTTRCSSQDPGVDSEFDFILATASLEVGYDDPDVSVILHHNQQKIYLHSFKEKAELDVKSFQDQLP